MTARPTKTAYIVLILYSIIILFPLAWIAVTALKTQHEIYSLPLIIIPNKVTFGNFSVVLGMSRFLRYVLNSVVVTVFSTLGVIVFGTLGGYPLGRMKFAIRGLLFGFLVLIMSVPWNIYLIPIYVIENALNLRNSWQALILPYIALRLPWALIIMSGAFASIPNDLEEASIIDGCSDFQMFRRILVPLVKPGMVTAVLLTFIFVWKEFMFAVTLNNDSLWQTLPVGIVFLKDELQTLAYGRISAAIIISLLPMLAIFLPLKRFFFEGMKEGGFLKE